MWGRPGGKADLMFGCTTRPTVGGRLWMGNVNNIGPGGGHTDTLADASMAAPNRAMTACVNPTERELVQMTLAADCRRQAAYRRLALTVLGLDVLSILGDPAWRRVGTTVREERPRFAGRQTLFLPKHAPTFAYVRCRQAVSGNHSGAPCATRGFAELPVLT
jgi:hypothetical protein